MTLTFTEIMGFQESSNLCSYFIVKWPEVARSLEWWVMLRRWLQRSPVGMAAMDHLSVCSSCEYRCHYVADWIWWEWIGVVILQLYVYKLYSMTGINGFELKITHGVIIAHFPAVYHTLAVRILNSCGTQILFCICNDFVFGIEFILSFMDQGGIWHTVGMFQFDDFHAVNCIMLDP